MFASFFTVKYVYSPVTAGSCALQKELQGAVLCVRCYFYLVYTLAAFCYLRAANGTEVGPTEVGFAGFACLDPLSLEVKW